MNTNRLLLISLVSLPILVGCKPASDKLDDINKILAANKENIDTCYDAVNTEGVKEKLLATTLSNGNEYVYDSKAKQFVVMNGDKIVQTTKGYEASKSTLDYFKFVYTYNPNSKYSQYLLEDANAPSELVITTGFDAGSHSNIKNVIYSNFSTTDDNVIIRPYSDYLKIEAPYQTVTHYDDSTNIIVKNIKQLNTCGICSYLKMEKGTVNFDTKGVTQMFEVARGCNEDVYIKSTTESYVFSLANCKKGQGEHEVKYEDAIELVETDILTETELRTTAGKAPGEDVPTLLRLQSDIIIDNDGSATLKPITFGHQVCLDLNGFKLSLSDFEKHDTDEIREAIRIESTNDVYKSVYIIDSTGLDDTHSGIFLNDCSIVVVGIDSDETTSNLAMNSGKITQTTSENADTDEIGAAVTLLGNKGDSGKPKYSTFYMTGGKITVNNESSIHDKFSCVAAEGYGTYVDILYGDLLSDDFCINGSVDKLYSIEEKEDYKLNLIGASLTSNNNSCVYLPAPSKVNIYDSTLVGATCVNLNSGTLNVNYSKLTSNGTGSQYSSRNYDGSVIYAPKATYDETTLDVTIKNNCELYSKFNYVINVTEKKDVTPNKTSLTFGEGTYSYKTDDGINKNSNTAVLDKKGTWTRHVY